ncbi:hypothetical protein GGTG_07302 [Gaeumannomyces tritici R3-111a-1]|uniref:Uncharacterized protein n=1 Tax=Gaeumannomyces tritici (strain R3-111a-1) TaxID=644352 RepID=J3P1A5_GAET3|nr:hypothetical protein GGTG_07302 [Gaeumannomyces tritici R3-111a-1]EJT77390.1 hypothetical protein GGTG_07302 [Gaeumannomyces tritici R3-111a-1]
MVQQRLDRSKGVVDMRYVKHGVDSGCSVAKGMAKGMVTMTAVSDHSLKRLSAMPYAYQGVEANCFLV